MDCLIKCRTFCISEHHYDLKSFNCFFLGWTNFCNQLYTPTVGNHLLLECPLHNHLCFFLFMSIMQSVICWNPGAQPPSGTLRHLESFFKASSLSTTRSKCRNNKSTEFASVLAFRLFGVLKCGKSRRES